MSKRIAVTGSTGLLGGYLIAELLGRGYDDIVLPVRSMLRLDNLYRTLAREGIELAEGVLKPIEVELNNPRELAEVFKGVDTIFHAAAIVSLASDDPAQLIETNVEMTSHVVNAALEAGVRLLVHTSSIAALGGMKKGKIYIDETTELEDFSTTSPYGQSKFFAENQVWRGAAEGLKVVVVNPAVILGVGDWASGGSTLVIPMLSRGLPFYTGGSMAYVDVRDVARAEVMLSECEKAYGQRFVLAAENLTFKQAITLSAEAAGKRKPLFCAPVWATELAWRGDALLSKITGRTPLLTKAAARSAQEKTFYNGGKIKQYIDFKYIPIRKTIAEVVQAYNEHQSAKKGAKPKI